MTLSRTNENYFKGAVFLLIGLLVVLEIVARRGFFADGAYYLVRILEKQDFNVQEPMRLFMYWFTQFPAVLAIKLGVTNLPFLTYLFSAWLIMSPVLFWTLALWKLKDDVLFWPFVALFAFVFLNTNFFIIGEYNVCYALSAFCLAMLLRRQASDFTDFALLMFAALVLTMTYAATMFIGPLLFGLCIKNAAQAETGRMRLYWLVLACPFLASIAVGFWDFLNPGIASNKEHALDPSALRNDRQFWLTGACAGLVFMQLMLRQKFARDALLLLVLAIEIINLTGVTNPTPFRCYSVRAFVGLSLAGLGFLMIVLRFGLWNWLSVKCRFKELPAHYYVIPIFILFAEMAIWDMRESLAYTQYIDDFTQIVDSNGGFIEHQNWSWRNANDPWFGWTWTYPSMSLVLRNSTHAAIILNPPYGVPEQIFDPHTNLPDLSRYY